MARIIKKSVAPIYAVGAVWLAWALLLPLYRPVHYVLAAAASLAVYLVGRYAIWKDRVILTGEQEPAGGKAAKETKEEPAPQKSKKTGDPELDALVEEKEKALGEMRRLNEAIRDEKLSRQIDHLEEVTGKIIDYVVAHPEKKPQIRKFLNYYLPTTLKLLNAYDRMDSAGVSGTNIDGTMGKIETMMDTIVTAFDRQLDALFGDEALDISTDITVLEQMLAGEGLSGQQMQSVM